ncbi:MAG: cation:proton antiporter [Nanoarchaeota archaeon]
MVVESIFIELSIIIITAVILISIARLLKQPMIIAYIVTGIILSPAFFNVIKSTPLNNTLSEIGVAVLLFTVGLNLNPKIIKEVGKVSIITGIGQILFTAIIGYLIIMFLGFNKITSLYLSIALTFSSTVIITKLLSDKGDLHKLYGKIAIGFLIVQDFIAIIALMVVSSFSNGNTLHFVAPTFVKGAALLIGLFSLGYIIIPRITKPIAKSSEFMLLFSLGWCLVIATLFELFGFSIEIGALLAGITLSFSPYRYDIISKLKPIRDFFIFLFFIWIGSQLVFADITKYTPTIIILSLFILIGNPLIMMILMGALKYKKRTGFLTGLVVAQISEFSHILIALGVKIGHIQSDMISLITVIGLITITGSSYFVIYGDKIYSYLSKYLSIFERKSTTEEEKRKEKKYEIILFGAHRVGHDILDAFKHKKNKLLIVDYNPEVIERLTERKFNCIYGDISDIDLLDEINLCDAKMVISTVPDKETNMLFIKRVKLCNPKAIILTVANSVRDALDLYDKGVTYVITPKFIGGKHISEKIKTYQFDLEKFIEEQTEHKRHLRTLGE